MNSTRAGAILVATAAFVSVASAQDHDLAQGEKLYASQCMICHGRVAPPPTAQLWPSGIVHLAMQQPDLQVTQDVSVPLTCGLGLRMTTDRGRDDLLDAIRIVVAPPYGPNLKGIIGRPAGSVKGFGYSNAFLQSLKGMEWTEPGLDIWITNPQKWVPGVYMYYKQPDPEVRRKIILYLKANP